MPVLPYPPLLDTVITYTRTRELALETLLNLRKAGMPCIENLSLEDVMKTSVTTLRHYIRLYGKSSPDPALRRRNLTFPDAKCADGTRLPRSRQEVDSFFSAWLHTRDPGGFPTSVLFPGRLPRAYGPLALGKRREHSLNAVLRALLFGRGVWVREEVLHALQDILEILNARRVLSVKRQRKVQAKEESVLAPSKIALPSCWSVFSSRAEMFAVNHQCIR